MNVEQFSTYIRENVDPGAVVTPFARGYREKEWPWLDRDYPQPMTVYGLAYAVSYVNKSLQDVTAVIVGDRHRIVMVNGEFVDKTQEEVVRELAERVEPLPHVPDENDKAVAEPTR